MRIRSIVTIGATTAGLGAGGAAAAIAATGSPSMQVASAQLTSAGASTSASTSSSTSTTANSTTCDDGAWIGQDDLRVEGAPDRFDAGDRGATYVWHDTNGWHIRATDPAGRSAHYTGVITLTKGATFHDVDNVRFEKDDHVQVLDGGTVLRYSFATYSGIDGVDFRVSACAGDRAHEAITFTLRKNGSDDDASRIFVGDHKQHPDSNTWRVFRQV